MSDDLIEWLRTHGFDRQATFEEIKGNEFDKESFALASDDNLKELCGGTQGPLIKLKKCRDMLKSETPTVQPPAKSAVVTHARSSVDSNWQHSGPNTPEHIAVLQELEKIKRTLSVTPGATSTLSLKFMKARWIDTTIKASEEELVKCACQIIEQEATQFYAFVKMLEDMAGMQYAVKNLKEAVKHTPEKTSATPASTRTQLDFSCVGKNAPTLKELMNVGSKVAAQWKNIGTELGLSDHGLDIIEFNTSGKPNSAQEAMRMVFRKWYNSEASPYTWQTLANALSSDAVGENAVVRELHRALTHAV